MNRLMAIRWTWHTSIEEHSNPARYVPMQDWMEEQRDCETEQSCEVEYENGLWWCSPDSFGLVLDPEYPIRKVWATDVHTFIGENGLLVVGDPIDPEDNNGQILEASGWDEAHQRFLEWRPTPEDKIWWAEATFPARPPVVAFARPKGSSKNAKWNKMHRIARKVFGDLPIITVKAHPDAKPEDVPVEQIAFFPHFRGGWFIEKFNTVTCQSIWSCRGFMDDLGNLVTG